MKTKTLAIQTRSNSTVVWCDYIYHTNEEYARNILDTLRCAENRISGPHRRKFRLVSRTTQVTEEVIEE